MVVQFAKWGNSLALRIPAPFAKEIGATENSEAELTVRDGKLIVSLVEDVPTFDLEALVARITEANRHEETGSGPAVGAEFG